jgi:hypothetical protein
MCSNSQGYYGSNNNTSEDVIDNNQSILERIAMISHGGGLIGFADESSALNEIRRLSQPFVGNQVNEAQFLSAPIDSRGYIDLRQVREKRLPKPNKQDLPDPQVAKEVEELVKWLKGGAPFSFSNSGLTYRQRLDRVATLLLQHHHLLSLCAKEVESLMEQQAAPTVVPQKEENREFVLKEMTAEDGTSLGWYVNHSDFYCDIQKEDGVWGVYFRDKITDQDAYGEPNET